MKSNWQEQAACARVDPELFFPEKGQKNRTAKKICRRCPVINECLQDCLDFAAAHPTKVVYGVWGGTSERERRRLRHATPEPASPISPDAFEPSRRAEAA